MKSKNCSPVRDFLNTVIPNETLYAINTMYILYAFYLVLFKNKVFRKNYYFFPFLQ